MNLTRTALRLALGRRLPTIEGKLTIDGPHSPITIRRDRFGIPHIDAAGDHDAFFGLGFCQGQDRSFQLEVLLRLGRGTLAEVVGAEALPIDRLSRRIGFWRTAPARLAALAEEERLTLEAFAAGVRAGVERGLARKAHEFALLRTEPTPFLAADVAAVLAVIAFTLAANWDSELARLEILDADGPEALAAVDPSYPEWLPTGAEPLVPAGPALDRLAADVAAFRRWTGTSGGSNTWAVAPGRTSTGGAILANDPHLQPSLPAHWYLCHLTTPEWGLAGASFVGAPGVPSGHNGFAAWGVTAGLIDNTDLYVEEIGPDGRSVRAPDGFVPCEVVTEVISVKNAAPVSEEVLLTPRGPIIGPPLEGHHDAISIQATWLRLAAAEGLLRLHRVGSFDDLRRAFRSWPGSSFGIAYADTTGSIGWALVGDTPRRRHGEGALPLAGWDPDAGWPAELVPPESLPSRHDPETGFVASANSRPSAGDDSPYLGIDWIDGYRLARIAEQLEGRSDWNVVETMRLQLDRFSIPWREMRDIVLAAVADRPELVGPAATLAGWDGVLSPDSEAAALYELFFSEMDRRIVAAKAPGSLTWAMGKGFTSIVPYNMFAFRRAGFVVFKLRTQPAGWFEGSWEDEIAAALGHAARTLAGRPDRRWGAVRPLYLRHPVAARKPLERVFNIGPIPWGGDTHTVGQSSPDPLHPASEVTIAIASLRTVVDLAHLERSRFVLPGGQSGNPLSPHYADQVRLWIKGDGVPIPWRPGAVEAATHHTLILRPG